ncbi:MAG: glycosyltransferase [Comamonas sp.]
MMGIAIPAHNEAEYIADCLAAVQRSMRYLAQHGQQALVVVAADACTDATAAIARQWADHVLEIDAHSVGIARQSAAQWLLEQGAQWIACTDADTLVPEDWLYGQNVCKADVFCGIVRVQDWGDYAPEVIAAFHATTPQVGHPHIHGANMGLSRWAYELVGGFLNERAHEDVSLIRRCEQAGLNIARLIDPCVVTSARRNARAREGFGDFLLQLEQQVMQVARG